MPIPSVEFLRAVRSSRIFVETGSHQGDGIQMALDAGYPEIYSTDISLYAYAYCCGRFRNVRGKVNLHHLDSREFLKRFLERLTTSAVFWLDAHWCNTDGGKPEDVPLLQELRLIRDHPVKNHTILIDDVRLFGTPHYPTLHQVRAKIMTTNSLYRIYFHNSDEFKADILVAHIPPAP